MPALDDLQLDWGGDLVVTNTGDLARVNGVARSEQRVVRRLLTNPGAYKTHTKYGAGLRQAIGSDLSAATSARSILGQMQLEPSVAQSPPPTATVTAIPNGLSARISYVALPDRQPTALALQLDDSDDG